MKTLISRNPATGEVIRKLDLTPPEALPKIFQKAHTAQKNWAARSVRDRVKFLFRLREVLLNEVDELVELIARENGKPKFEALAHEILPAVDTLTYFARRAPKLLRTRNIPLTLMKHRRSDLQYWPVGTVAIIAPWNYPFLLPMANIVMAIVSGNAVIFKPSEVTPCIGLKIQELFADAGLPSHLLQTLIGDGSLGAAIIEQKPNKIFFTGSTKTGRKVMSAAAEHLIPVNLELGGKDAMIVLPDANVDFATSAALWGGYSNAGQICASTERILVHEKIADAFVQQLKLKLEKLRIGPSHPTASNDLGPITLEKQKSVYSKQLNEAKAHKATIITGGEFTEDKCFLKPTLVTGSNLEELTLYQEETFGPIVTVTPFKTVAEAIKKANESRYGLLASVITRNHSLAEEIAKQLEVGTVVINEVTYTAGLGETPWGGVKESGFGRTHSDIGLYEFVNVRHIHQPRPSFLIFKSLWWFPYTPFQYETFRTFLKFYRRSWFEKLRAFPHFLWNLLQFLKSEKRL